MTHKEFYIWLDGFMTNRGWTDFKQGDIETIQEKMKEVKEVNKNGMFDPSIIPIPVNPFPVNPPFPVKDDPYRPPYEVYCGDKTQLND
jgi:hypothetical protein